MDRGTTSCTALTFVRNGGEVFERCLRSALFCREHIVLDGGSTDGTLDRALRFGCRVIPQDPRFLDGEGRIVNYAGVTNQGLFLAGFSWVVIIAGDEEFSFELQRNIHEAVQGPPHAYLVHRSFVYRGRLMRFASTNPNAQIRLMHRDVIEGFRNVVHEHPILKAGVVPSVLPGHQELFLTETPAELRWKYHRYFELEMRRLGGIGWKRWVGLVVKRFLVMGYLLSRMFGYRLTHRWRDCLPLRYEFLNIWYAWRLVVGSCPLHSRISSPPHTPSRQ